MQAKLMLGNEAVAQGFYEAGCRLVSAYPGTPSTEVTEAAAGYDGICCEWAPNEKVALETAFGASLAGARSACVMKHVGLNVAADPLFTLSYTGVNGGLVVCVADDPGMHSSQNEQDSRRYAVAAKVPMLEPSDAAEAKEMAAAAFGLSEDFDTPVLLRMSTRVSHTRSPVEAGERAEAPLKPYRKDPKKYVMAPANAVRRHPEAEARLRRLADYAETCGWNRLEEGGTDLGVICSGACYQYVREALGPSASVLKLGLVHPLPDALIRRFAAGVRRLVVVEELDPVIETHVRALGFSPEGKSLFPAVGEFSQNLIRRALGLPVPKGVEEAAIPGRPPVMCPGCPHRGILYVLARRRLTVIGDIGCYTLGASPPLCAVDSVLCMGASLSGVHGFSQIRGTGSGAKTAAVIGDSTFIHSGMTGLVNIAYNASNALVVILDNSTTGMTGHQPNPATGYNLRGEPAARVDLEAFCRAVGIPRVTVVDPYDLEACDRAVAAELAAEGPGVIIARRPCALLKGVRRGQPVRVDPDLCRSCRRCVGLGCPAIRLADGKAAVDAAQCVGCGVCAQLCPFDAIREGE